jgi:hypothetical protein
MYVCLCAAHSSSIYVVAAGQHPQPYIVLFVLMTACNPCVMCCASYHAESDSWRQIISDVMGRQVILSAEGKHYKSHILHHVLAVIAAAAAASACKTGIVIAPRQLYTEEPHECLC